MAYNWQTARGLVRLSRKQLTITSPLSTRRRRRSVHVSVYDKNPEEEHEQEHVSRRSEEADQQDSYYWAPHPKTGVFGPSPEENSDDDTSASSFSSSYVKPTAASSSIADSTTLEQKTFFRPLEDMENCSSRP